jgi:cyclic pyranopterin phosphate synthase
MSAVFDQLRRPLGSLRISVTDRCNLRCAYCMPEEDYVWLKRDELLSFEEIAALARIFTRLGAGKVRLTGGEPLLRRDLDGLIRQLTVDENLRDLALTTNGVFLAAHAAALRNAGLRRVTVSLDTLQPDRFRALTRRDNLQDVLEGICAVGNAGFARIKFNTVVVRDFNDDELSDILAFARETNGEARFIEYMDVGGATRWMRQAVVSRDEILARLTKTFGRIEPLAGRGAMPAERYALEDGTTFGIIASVTAPFCGDCDRSRLTVDGVWLLCLYTENGVNLREMLRGGKSVEEIALRVEQIWNERSDRGAEERRQLDSSGTRRSLYQIQDLRRNPHREMHTRGG